MTLLEAAKDVIAQFERIKANPHGPIDFQPLIDAIKDAESLKKMTSFHRSDTQ